MKVTIAIDSFKESMSSMEAGNAAKEGILKACDAEAAVKPLADGGEGTTEALVEGLGFAFLSFVPGAELKSGIEIVLNAIKLEEKIKDSDIVVTGEGRLDFQTVMGKVPVGVAVLTLSEKIYKNGYFRFECNFR